MLAQRFFFPVPLSLATIPASLSAALYLIDVPELSLAY